MTCWRHLVYRYDLRDILGCPFLYAADKLSRIYSLIMPWLPEPTFGPLSCLFGFSPPFSESEPSPLRLELSSNIPTSYALLTNTRFSLPA